MHKIRNCWQIQIQIFDILANVPDELLLPIICTESKSGYINRCFAVYIKKINSQQTFFMKHYTKILVDRQCVLY